MEVIGLLIVAALAVWVYSDAKARNDPQPVAWAIGTFLLAIIVLPAWFLKRQPKASAAMRRCPHCAEEIQHATIFCTHCGQNLATAPSDIPRPAANEPTTESAANSVWTMPIRRRQGFALLAVAIGFLLTLAGNATVGFGILVLWVGLAFAMTGGAIMRWGGGFIGAIILGAIGISIGGNASSSTPTRLATSAPVLSTGSSSASAASDVPASARTRVREGFGNGTHIVDDDIQPGVYRSTGTSTCYWARLRGFGNELNDIIANGNNGPEIVAIGTSDAAFESRGCGQWRTLESGSTSAATEFEDGTYAVGVHIAPGTYRANGDGICYWARLSDFGHELDGIIANGNSPTVVRIAPTDEGFTTFGCGSWRRIQ